MLPRATYFKTLAELGDARSPEWHATAAGLVVLRLVDDWLDLGPPILSEDRSDLQAIQELIAQIPNAHLLQSLLTQVVGAVSRSKYASVQAVRPSLLVYAQSLEYGGKFALAEDVLIPLRTQAESRKDANSVIAIALRLARIFRKSGAFDSILEQYAIADHYARIIGDTITPLYIREGHSHIIAAQGNAGLADDMCAEVIMQASRTANSRLLSCALHSRGAAALINGNADESLPFLYRALEHTHTGHDYIRADIAAAYQVRGDIQMSNQINTLIAVTAQDQFARCNAMINLLFSAVLLRDEQMFDLYRQGLAFVPMRPWHEFYFREYLALGYHAFGRPAAAEKEFSKQRALAEQYGFRMAGN